MRTVSLKIPDELEAKVRVVAARRGTTRSAVMRDALEAYVDAAGRASAGDFAALAADLNGCIDGPDDLSVSDLHMAGYGQ